MAEHHLNGPQVRTAFQQVAGKGMPQCVRGYFLVDSRFHGVFFQKFPESLTGHGFSARATKRTELGIFFSKAAGPF